MILTSHGDGGGAAEFSAGDEGGGELVGVLQSQDGRGCSREVLLIREPVLVVGDVGHQSCSGGERGREREKTTGRLIIIHRPSSSV